MSRRSSKSLAIWLKAAGVTVHVVAPERGDIRGWDHKDWGHPVPIDRTLDQVRPDDYDAVVLPGGQINPDLLRIQPAALDFIRTMHAQGKTVAAVCHAPWLLIETGIAKGGQMTSYKSIKTDVMNAGANWKTARSWLTATSLRRAIRAISKRSPKKSSKPSRNGTASVAPRDLSLSCHSRICPLRHQRCASDRRRAKTMIASVDRRGAGFCYCGISRTVRTESLYIPRRRNIDWTR